MIQRIHPGKSLVDMALAIGACKEYMQNKEESFVIASSDSDFYSLISGLPECNFLILMEKEKQSDAVLETMNNYGISHDFIDDFSSSNLEKLQMKVIEIELQDYFDSMKINFDEIFYYAIDKSRASLSDSEMRQMKEKILQKLILRKREGEVSIDIL